uniref:Toxin candidate TRINITY_DN18779_c0_g1_i1 n=1 Tax=Ceriantheomorphe brasiliensis TaxID=1048506 RepID=A0A7G7WZ49_9CNID|nr:toxin candidate TRINITY_DN18779_c0_g1_i1 [Ceriantheomorphe brasiliensis]
MRFCILQLVLLGVVEVFSFEVMYVPPMTLGRSFDVSQFNIGTDVFPFESLRQRSEIPMRSTKVVSRIIKSAKDIEDVLDVSGQLSLKLKMGMLSIKGSGKYVKSTSSNENTVEMLIKITFRTVAETLIQAAQPYADWSTKKNLVGKHYVRAITYGGELIASLKFDAKETTAKEEIEAQLQAGIDLGGGVFDAEVYGRYASMIESASSSSDISIKIYSTAAMTKDPDSLESFIAAINEFPNQIKKSAGGRGIPIKADIAPLSTLPGATPELMFEHSRMFHLAMSTMVEYYDDIMYTINAIDNWLRKQSCPLTSDLESELYLFHRKLLRVNRLLVAEMISLDLGQLKGDAGVRKIQQVYNIYYGERYSKTRMTGRYMRKFKTLINAEKPAPQLVATLNGYIAFGIVAVERLMEKTTNDTNLVNSKLACDSISAPNTAVFSRNAENRYVIGDIQFLATSTEGKRFRQDERITFEEQTHDKGNQIKSSGNFRAPEKGIYLISHQIVISPDSSSAVLAFAVTKRDEAHSYLKDRILREECRTVELGSSTTYLIMMEANESIYVELSRGLVDGGNHVFITGTLVFPLP